MSLVGKLVSKLAINAPAPKFYEIIKGHISYIPNICPTIVQRIEIDGGNWDNHGHGSIKTWYYTIDGKAEILKERVEFDDNNLVMGMIGLEGDVFKLYITFKATFQLVPKGPDHSSGIITLEYEKIDEYSPHPQKYLDILTEVTKVLNRLNLNNNALYVDSV